MKFLSTWVKRLSQADIVFYIMPALIALLLVGTIAQKHMGLYVAQKMFFSSFVFWIGFVPLPGGYLLIGLLTVFLSLKFIFHSKWTFEKSGVNLSHFGVLVLLAGGLLTAMYAREGYMIIPEGGQSPYVYDYIERELSIFEGGQKRIVPFERLEQGADLSLPFSLKVHQLCKNCEIKKREESDQGFGEKPMQSFARFMALQSKASALDPEENLSGITFEVSGLSEDQDGIYIAFEGMPRPIEFTYQDRTYLLILGKAQRVLPFELKLNDFEKQSYPGTDQAKEYLSDLVVLDGDVEWPVRVSMNEPLRYKGYTFYQSSFEKSPEGELTILSVVENQGRLFPYLGTLIVMIGLILHLIIVLRGRGEL